MSAFSRAITDGELATQVAALLNTHNQLNLYYTPSMIQQGARDYIVEAVGGKVIGCVKVEKQSYNLTEIKHLVINPIYRNIGLAKLLVSTAVQKVGTPLMYAMIRESNITSQKVFESCGLKNTGEYTTADRDVLLFSATANKWRKVVDKLPNYGYTNI